MGAANVVAYEEHPDHITGPTVHTPYRAETRNDVSFWKHK